MSHDEAQRAACDAAAQGEANFRGVTAKSGAECNIDDSLRDRKWAAYFMWAAKAPGFWCPPMRANIYLDFSDRDGRLKRIAAYCPPLDP